MAGLTKGLQLVLFTPHTVHNGIKRHLVEACMDRHDRFNVINLHVRFSFHNAAATTFDPILNGFAFVIFVAWYYMGFDDQAPKI